MKNALIFIAASAMSICAGAATVYKCKNAHGQIEMSDTACAVGSTGSQVELKPNSLDNSSARAEAARDDAANYRQQATQSGQLKVDRSQSHECQIAQKNAWGADKAVAQRKADLACMGAEGAAAAQQQRANNRPVISNCSSNGYGQITCISR